MTLICLKSTSASTAVGTLGNLSPTGPAISKHLWVLEEAGVLRRTIEGRTHRLLIQPGVLSETPIWMDRMRALWGRLFDVVDEYLKEDRPR